jgi:hypothetical protein
MPKSIEFMIIPPPTPTIDPKKPATAPRAGENSLAFFIWADSFVLPPEVVKTLLLKAQESHHVLERGRPMAASLVQTYSEYSR